MTWATTFHHLFGWRGSDPVPDLTHLQAEIDARLAQRKAARLEANPHKRGHLTRQINRGH